MTKEQIKHMADRFLQWRLPEDFNPDGGISFQKTEYWRSHAVPNMPVGTNLLTATQAELMVQYMVEGLTSETESMEKNEPVTPRLLEEYTPGEGIVCVLMENDGEFSFPLEDADKQTWTLGFNNDRDVGDGEGIGWQFVGWDWNGDQFVETNLGTPIGWLPFDPCHFK